jgi:site-specific recombinase XerD
VQHVQWTARRVAQFLHHRIRSRHTFIEDGYGIRTAQDLLGHRDVSTTMTYLHVLKRGALGVRSPADRL